jgi:tetratricopeptide (TPR) repeat protein
LIKAVRLDPTNAENWNTLGRQYRIDGDYGLELNAFRRAVAIDPLWVRTHFDAAESAWNLNSREESDRYSVRAERGAAPGSFEALMPQSDRQFRRGDYSGSLATAGKARSVAPPGRLFYADLARARAWRAAGNFADARPAWPFYKVDEIMWRMWRNEAPSPAAIAAAVRKPRESWRGDHRISFMLATLINAGRDNEAASLFDARFPNAAAMRRADGQAHSEFVRRSALVAMALERVGRSAEARGLIRHANDEIGRVLRSRAVPNWYYALAAQLWSVEGRREQAIAALERAYSLGWRYNAQRDSLGDMELEPTYRNLRSDRRFKALAEKTRAHMIRERSEMKSKFT